MGRIPKNKMTMKKMILLVALCIASVCTFATQPHTIDIDIDINKSTIFWKGLKVAESHDGTVKMKSGHLVVDHGTLVGGEFVIDMNTIVNTDIESAEYRAKLEGHLKSDDFFDVDQFPTAILVIESAEKKEQYTYAITAQLTIKGITHEVQFDARVPIKGNQFQAEANIIIDRTKWGITYNSGNFFKDLGDYMIKDEIEFRVVLGS